MNKDFHTYLKKMGDDMRLSESERARMRGMLHAYMGMKPLRTDTRPVALPVWNVQWLYAPRPLAATLALALFVSSAGVSYAAQGALPGDALYPVKVHLNEPVSGALAVSASAKTEWAMSVAGERLKEAATLAAEGRLSAMNKADLQENFESHATLAIQNIDEQAGTSPDSGARSALRFEAQLSEYGRVLGEVVGTENGAGAFVAAVRSQEDKIASVRVRAERRTTANSSPERAIAASRMRDAAKHQLDDSFDLARKAAPALATSSAHIVAEGLSGASTTISDGEELLGKDSAPEALGVFQGALSATEKLGVFLKTSSVIHKRTGKIITEPKERSKLSSRKSGNDESRENGSTDTAFTVAAQPSQAATLAATATTDIPIEARENDNGEQEDSNKRGTDGRPMTPALPISAPPSLIP